MSRLRVNAFGISIDGYGAGPDQDLDKRGRHTAGDGFFVRFDSPARALECARAAREAVNRLGIDIRVGIHTGECELQGRTLAGMAMHVAARIQELAGPGDILVSSTVKDIVVGSATRF